MDQAWIELHYPSIHRAAWWMTGSVVEADDLAQQTFVVALDRWHTFDGRSEASTWLFGILLRLRSRRARSLARLQRRVAEYLDRRSCRVSVDPAADALEQEWRRSVWAEVARLPKTQRDVVWLRFVQQMTHEQIAAIVGCSVGTARTRLHHALKKLERSSAMRHAFASRPMPSDTYSQMAAPAAPAPERTIT